MARLSGINIPDEKRAEIALTYVHGIGLKTSQEILKKAKMNFDTRVKDFTEAELANIQTIINEMEIQVEGELRRVVRQNVRRLMDIKSYRGLRHRDSFR